MGRHLQALNIVLLGATCVLVHSASLNTTNKNGAKQLMSGQVHFVVGVLAIRGADSAFEQFNQTFNSYLSDHVGRRFEPPVSFSMVALNFHDTREKVRDHQVDLVFVNPAVFSCIDSEFGAASLATIKRQVVLRGETQIIDAFGGVIIAKSDRHDISSVADVRGKSYAAASISGLGSGQAQFLELFKRGISFVHDVKQAIFTSNQNDVVKIVESGRADVGFVRDNQIQKMVNSGAVREEDFKVVEGRWHEYDGGTFPYALTTELFPEWNLAALSTVPEIVKTEIQHALLDMAPGDPASAGRYHSWAPSKSYMLLRNMQADLGYIGRSEGSGELECIWGADLYDAVVCPPGTYRDTEDNVMHGCERAGVGCPEGSECLCSPCREGHAIDIFPQKPGDVGTLTHCERMETCETVEQGHGTSWVLQDNMQRSEQLAVEVIFREPMDLLSDLATTNAVRIDARPSATVPFQYLLEIPGRISTGLHVVELRVGGQHLEASPLFVRVAPRDCERDYPGAQRTASEHGECECAEASFPVASACVSMHLLPAIVGGPLLLALVVVASYALRSRRATSDDDENDVSRRVVSLRKLLWLQNKDGFRIDGEWSMFRQTTHIKTRMLENLARLTLLRDFDTRQVDMLVSILRFWGDFHSSAENGLDSYASSKASSSNLDHEKQQYLGVRHLLLEVSKRILDPSVPDGPIAACKEDRAFAWASQVSSQERFAFFQDKIAKLKIWEEGHNFLFLKGVVQYFMDDLRKSCDDLYQTITMEAGGSDLIALDAPASDVVWRQDHPEVQAIPVVESLSREVQLHKLTSHSHHDLRRDGLLRDTSPVGSPMSFPRRRHHQGTSARAILDSWLRKSPQDTTTLPIDPPDHHSMDVHREECFTVAGDVDLEENLRDIEAGETPVPSKSPSVGRESSKSGRPDFTNAMGVRQWLRSERPAREGAGGHRLPSGGKGMASLLRAKCDPAQRRMEWLRSLHAELKESAQDKDKAGVGPGDLRNEEPFVAHLVNRAELLNEAFQQQVRSVFSHGSDFSLSGAMLPEVVPGPVKTKQRMIEKAASYAEDNDDDAQLPLAAMILDPVRVSLVCQSTLQVLQSARWLLEHGEKHNLQVVRLKNKFATRDSTEYDGYRDIMLCVLFKGSFGLNIIGEIQIQDERMHALKVKMHRLYKVKRATAANKI